MSYVFFYKSVNGDRVYDDTSFEHWLKKFFTSGVFLNDLQVTANNDMTVTVGTGYTNIDGKVKIFESETPLIIETAGASYPRIDSIVLERNDTERDILLKVIKGGYSSEPVAHVPVRQDGVYQLVIAEILVNAGAVKVTQADITDTRSNTELCGIVAGAVDQIDFSQVQAQFDAYLVQYKKQLEEEHAEHNADMEAYLEQMEAKAEQMEADFAAWFENVRNQLDEDAAGHLQNQIDDINARLEYAGGSMIEITVESNDEEYNVVGLEVNLEIDGKTYTETIPSEKVVKFTGILEVGEAVITCVDEAQEIDTSASINIPYYGAYETSIVCGGGSYEKWIEAGGLNPSSYESLDALLEDEAAIRTLMTKKEAVDVLTRISGDDLTTIINHPYVAKWVNYREYAYSTLSAVSEIKTIMDASGMYGMYITVESDGTWQPKGLVPVMTSSTAPYGKVTASSDNGSTREAWQVFNTNDESTFWHANKNVPQWLQYAFTSPTCVRKVELRTWDYGFKAKLQASNDGSTWNDLKIDLDYPNVKTTYTIDIDNEQAYLYYRLYFDDSYYVNNGVKYVLLHKLQFYGRQLEALIPPMTSNTTPIGVASASSLYNSTNYNEWKAFDDDITSRWISIKHDGAQYIQYEFNNPTVVNSIKIGNSSSGDEASFVKSFDLLGSNDGTQYDLIYSGEHDKNDKGIIYYHAFDNSVAYKYYRVLCKTSFGSYDQIAAIQLYGTPDYESRTYIYEHGVEVMPITAYANGHTAEKQADQLFLYKNNASTVTPQFYTTNAIDLTSKTVLYTVMGNVIVPDSDGWAGAGMICSSVPMTNSNYNNINIAKTPFTKYKTLTDISNINQEAYVQHSLITSATNSMKATITEWWLE